MKRFWLGAGILAVLLALGLWTGWGMGRLHDPVATDLSMAAEAALGDDWARAEDLATDAYSAWKGQWHMTASVADHYPMDEIDSLFVQLPVFARQGDATHFAATCARLSELVKALGEAHGLSWWNLL